MSSVGKYKQERILQVFYHKKNDKSHLLPIIGYLESLYYDNRMIDIIKIYRKSDK